MAKFESCGSGWISSPAKSLHSKTYTILSTQRVAIDTSEPLSPAAMKRVQDIVGTMLNYDPAVDPTLLTALSAIAAHQATGTKGVAEACQQLLDYVATHPNVGIRYKACDMILAICTDTSYLSEQEGKSRAASHFYLTNKGNEEFNNGAILTLSSIIKHVVSSASKVELAALCYGCKLAIPIHWRKWAIASMIAQWSQPTTSWYKV